MSAQRNSRSLLFTVSAIVISAISFALVTGGRRPAPAFAADEIGTTAGQLTILDKKGQPAALCPLKHTDVVADVSGYCARVTVRQDFANPSKEAIEAVYTFPLPSDAAVDDMTMTIGRRVVKGEIKRREEARVIYETAKAAGQAAALLDQERPNIFTQSVANIMPGERIAITISYVQVLKYADGEYEFNYPMVVGPRFVPGGGHVAPGARGVNSPSASQQVPEGSTQAVVTDASKITPPITPKGTRAGHDISLTVNLDAGLPLIDVNSQLHNVRVNRAGKSRAVVRLENQNEIPNRDFILRYKAAGSEVAEGLLAYANPSSKSGYFTLILQPPADTKPQQITPKEMVFVIDQTGSQAGAPIKKAKETMRYCIQNLNPDDTFQLIGFNTEVYPCFPAPVEANPTTIAQALKFLEPIEGSGGTDILKSVDYALKIPDDPDRLRIICYMTDGYVGNDMQIIEHVKKNRGRTRMFPCGVGNSVNRFLIEGMAKEGRGVADIVDLNANSEAVASKFYKRMAQPLLLDIHVDWNGLPVEEVFPKQNPDLFSAGPIILKGRYSGPAEGDIIIRGLLRGKPWSRNVHVVLPAQKNDGAALATIWAREKIEDLQSEDWMGAQSGHPMPEIKEKIVNTALEYRLMSQYTSFVAVEQKVVNIGGKQRTVDVPVEMPDGVSYEGIFGESQVGLAKANLGVMSAGASRGFNRSRAAGGGAGFGGGGFGAGGLGGARGGAPSGPSPSKGKPGGVANPSGGTLPALQEKLAYDVDNTLIVRFQDEKSLDALKALSERAPEAEAKLSKLKPEDQKKVRETWKQQLRSSKLSAKLREMLKKPGVKLLEVQVWVRSMPSDAKAQLAKAGFTLGAELSPGKLLLGTISSSDMDKLLELGWVQLVEQPKFK
jgi:Ca-activated chloride channel family protein